MKLGNMSCTYRGKSIQDQDLESEKEKKTEKYLKKKKKDVEAEIVHHVQGTAPRTTWLELYEQRVTY